MINPPTTEESVYLLSLCILSLVPAIALLVHRLPRALALVLSFGPSIIAGFCWYRTGYLPQTVTEGIILLVVAVILSAISLHLAIDLFIGDLGHGLMEVFGIVATVLALIQLYSQPLPAAYVFILAAGVGAFSALLSWLKPHFQIS